MSDQAPAAAPPVEPVDIEALTAKYVVLRDKIKEIADRHAAELKPFNDMKGKLDAFLLDHLTQQNVKSMKTKAGTITRTDRKSCTVQDTDAFRTYVQNFGQWDLADLRANAPAVAQHLEDKGALPPGVNYSVFSSLSVRRSND